MSKEISYNNLDYSKPGTSNSPKPNYSKDIKNLRKHISKNEKELKKLEKQLKKLKKNTIKIIKTSNSNHNGSGPTIFKKGINQTYQQQLNQYRQRSRSNRQHKFVYRHN